MDVHWPRCTAVQAVARSVCRLHNGAALVSVAATNQPRDTAEPVIRARARGSCGRRSRFASPKCVPLPNPAPCRPALGRLIGKVPHHGYVGFPDKVELSSLGATTDGAAGCGRRHWVAGCESHACAVKRRRQVTHRCEGLSQTAPERIVVLGAQQQEQRDQQYARRGGIHPAEQQQRNVHTDHRDQRGLGAPLTAKTRTPTAASNTTRTVIHATWCGHHAAPSVAHELHMGSVGERCVVETGRQIQRVDERASEGVVHEQAHPRDQASAVAGEARIAAPKVITSAPARRSSP